MVIKHLLWQMIYAKPQAFETCEIKKKKKRGGGGEKPHHNRSHYLEMSKGLLSFYVFYSQIYNGPNALNNLRALC